MQCFLSSCEMGGSPTCLGAGEYAMVLCSCYFDSLLAVHSAIGQHHGGVVLIHEVMRDGTDELAVHMLRPGQLLCQLLELLQAATLGGKEASRK